MYDSTEYVFSVCEFRIKGREEVRIMLRATKIYLLSLWFVPTLIYFGLPSLFSLAIFLFPLVYSLFNINKLIKYVPLWSVFLIAAVVFFSSLRMDIAFANILIFSSLILQLPLSLFIVKQMNHLELISLVKLQNIICVIQICIALVQIFLWIRPGDSVNGSMLGDYHGTNLVPFLIFITILLNLHLGWIKRSQVFATSFIAVFIAIKSDAKLVLISVFLYILVVSLVRIFSGRTQFGIKLGSIFTIILIIIALIGTNFTSYVQGRWGYELGKAFSSKSLILEEFTSPGSEYSQVTSLVVGAGPAQTVSRSAIISDKLSAESTRKSALSASKPMFFDSYTQTTGKFNIGPLSSISQPISSVVGILGELGIVGSLAFIAMVIRPLKLLFLLEKHHYKHAFLLLTLFIFPLSYFNTFVEFPQAVFPFVIVLAGLALPSHNVSNRRQLL
jgi:hypothetical protein